MSETIQTTLLALKDVQGIEGSFVLNKEGVLLAMAMPTLFDASMLAELGPRIGRLAECFSASGDELESCLVRFADHMLCVKQFPKGGALCILTSRSVNLPALKMATNLADRRLANEIGAAKPLHFAPSEGAAVAAAPAVSTAAAAGDDTVTNAPEEGIGVPQPDRKVPHYYRGRLVED